MDAVLATAFEIEIPSHSEYSLEAMLFHDFQRRHAAETAIRCRNPAIRELVIMRKNDARRFVNPQQMASPGNQIRAVSQRFAAAISRRKRSRMAWFRTALRCAGRSSGERDRSAAGDRGVGGKRESGADRVKRDKVASHVVPSRRLRRVYDKFVLRRRAMKPTTRRPARSIVHSAGSGTGAISAFADAMNGSSG